MNIDMTVRSTCEWSVDTRWTPTVYFSEILWRLIVFSSAEVKISVRIVRWIFFPC